MTAESIGWSLLKGAVTCSLLSQQEYDSLSANPRSSCIHNMTILTYLKKQQVARTTATSEPGLLTEIEHR